MVTKKPQRKPISYTAKQYAALEAENLKLHKRILKLEAQNVSLKNGIIADADAKPLRELSMSQLEHQIRQLENSIKKGK